MTTETVTVNKDWLIWARKSVHYDKETVAKKLKIKKERLDEWETTGEISFKNLRKLSKIYEYPSALFFNLNDPVYEEEMPDFRTMNNKTIPITPEISFELRNAKRKREILLDIEEEDEEFIIPEFKYKEYDYNSNEEVIDIITDILKINNAKRRHMNLDYWINEVEKLGVLVFQFYNIPPKDLRGYAIYNDKLPIIGINHKENEKARKFTLFHELAHLFLKKEGLSNFATYQLTNNIEVKCNAIAAEILVPSKDIDLRIREKQIQDFTDDKWIKYFANIYKVSNEVIVRKFLNQKHITKKEYEKYHNRFNEYIFPEQKRRTPSKENKKEDDVADDVLIQRKLEQRKKEAKRCITENGAYYITSLITAYNDGVIDNLEFARYIDKPLPMVSLVIQRIKEEGS